MARGREGATGQNVPSEILCAVSGPLWRMVIGARASLSVRFQPSRGDGIVTLDASQNRINRTAGAEGDPYAAASVPNRMRRRARRLGGVIPRVGCGPPDAASRRRPSRRGARDETTASRSAIAPAPSSGTSCARAHVASGGSRWSPRCDLRATAVFRAPHRHGHAGGRCEISRDLVSTNVRARPTRLIAVCRVTVPANYASTLVGLRHRLGLSQAQLAANVGAAGKAVVYQWESGKRTPSPVFWLRIERLQRQRAGFPTVG
jgi:DNA-binding XRE family transcriptional regulator